MDTMTEINNGLSGIYINGLAIWDLTTQEYPKRKKYKFVTSFVAWPMTRETIRDWLMSSFSDTIGKIDVSIPHILTVHHAIEDLELLMRLRFETDD